MTKEGSAGVLWLQLHPLPGKRLSAKGWGWGDTNLLGLLVPHPTPLSLPDHNASFKSPNSRETVHATCTFKVILSFTPTFLSLYMY